MPESPLPPDWTLPQLWADAAARFAELPAILESEKSWSFAEIDQLSTRVAAGLCEDGLQCGDRVGLYCANSAAFAISYLGIVKAGGVVVAMHLLYHPKELAWILQNAEAKRLIYLFPFEAAVDQIAAEMPELERIYRIGGEPHASHANWQALCASSAPAPEPELNPAEDLAALLYTSGTTGRPKGAMLTHRNLVQNSFSVKEALGLEPGKDRMLVALPMFHAFAAMVGLLFPLGHGCSLIPVAKFDPAGVANAIQEHGATVLPLVPSMFHGLCLLPEGEEEKLSSIRLCISGGAAMPGAILERFEQKFGLPINEGDGPTECSPVTCVNPIGGPLRLGSVGFPVPRVEMKILDTEGQELPTGEAGEICVRGPNVMKGYWKLPEETEASFFGDWFRTGDVGHVDEDGYFYIVDRIKDMIIVNGMNIYPRVIEEVLHRHADIEEAAVVGVPHPTRGERPEAWLRLREGAELDTAALRSYCKGELGQHEIPRRFHAVEALPRNATGKINKRELRRQGEEERGVSTGESA